MTNKFDKCACDERVKRAQIIINEAIKQVHELGCGLVADGTIEGNGVWFDTLRVQDRQSDMTGVECNSDTAPIQAGKLTFEMVAKNVSDINERLTEVEQWIDRRESYESEQNERNA